MIPAQKCLHIYVLPLIAHYSHYSYYVLKLVYIRGAFACLV